MKYLLIYEHDTADMLPGPCWTEEKENISASSASEAAEKARRMLATGGVVRPGAKLFKFVGEVKKP